VAANKLKVGYTDALVSANTDVAANKLKVGYTEALVSANTDVSANKAAILTKADSDDPSFTTKITTPELHVTTIMSQNAHLKLGSQHTNDLNIKLNGIETLQITRSGSEVRYTAHGGSGSNRFNQDVICNGSFIFTPSTPSSSSAAGTVGTVAVDASYVYVCIATNTWRRIAIPNDATW